MTEEERNHDEWARRSGWYEARKRIVCDRWGHQWRGNKCGECNEPKPWFPPPSKNNLPASPFPFILFIIAVVAGMMILNAVSTWNRLAGG